MRHRWFSRTIAVLALIPVLAACSGESTEKTASSAVATSRCAGMAAGTAGAAATGSGSFINYAAYCGDRARYADGKVVLFFHAPWCPDCVKTEANLKADPAAIPAGLTIVHVDFDNADDLKEEYGITHQFTFVSLNSDGAARQKWTGTYTAATIAEKA
jgi:thioredoxin 1